MHLLTEQSTESGTRKLEYESKLKLINLVRNWPLLWQLTLKSYGKRGPRDVALKKVAVSLMLCALRILIEAMYENFSDTTAMTSCILTM